MCNNIWADISFFCKNLLKNKNLYSKKNFSAVLGSV